MDPNDIKLNNLNKIFEYERLSRELDDCNDVDTIKNVAKSYIKLYLATIETIANFK